MNLTNKNIKIFLNAVLGPAVFIWITYSIYKQITRQPDLPVAILYIKEALFGPYAWKLYLVIVLMITNWMIEARKWQVLMAPLQQMTLGKSFKSILAGVTLGVNTPNRIGEYGGRMLYMQEEARLKSISISALGNMSQLIVTMVLGCIGLFIHQEVVSYAFINYDSSFNWLDFFNWMVIGVTIATIVFYFYAVKVIAVVSSIPYINKWFNKINGLEKVNVTVLLRVLALSAIRYIVFVYQYILLLQLMHVEVNITDAFWLITVLYLILAIIPSITILELGIRGIVAVLLFGSLSENTLGIYAASAGIWLINLIVPAIAGGVFIPTLKVFKDKP